MGIKLRTYGRVAVVRLLFKLKQRYFYGSKEIMFPAENLSFIIYRRAYMYTQTNFHKFRMLSTRIVLFFLSEQH